MDGGRKTELFCDDWKFALGDWQNAMENDFADEEWERITLPHDWSIFGPFSTENPTLARGGYLPAGIGWYRKHFSVPKNYADKLVEIEFEGIFRHSEVWLNGKHLGYRPNGYIAQRFDISRYLRFDGENVIAVRADNSDQPASRYYSGCGIYRDVYLIARDKLHFFNKEPYITTSVNGNSAEIHLETTVQNDGRERNFSVRYRLSDAKGNVVADKTEVEQGFIGNGRELTFNHEINLDAPVLWSVDNPYLYSLKAEIISEGAVCDAATVRVGIRTLEFTNDNGFLLNGKRVQVKGVCLHHDNGCLGAQANDSADRRRLLLMKEMGCNAIRLSHNPFTKGFLDLCDEMGFLVMDEAFDEWRLPKNIPALLHYDMNQKTLIHNYYTDFDKWHRQDLSDMLLRDRNHPCIFCWSIGNEIAEQRHNAMEGRFTAKKLYDIVKEFDKTRPVTCACCFETPGTRICGFPEVLDVIGYNYSDHKYIKDHEKYPEAKVIGSEVTSLQWFRKRGWYDPTLFGEANDEDRKKIRDNGGEIIEDNEIVENIIRRLLIGEHTLKRHEQVPYVAGMFIWTGIDYLGEPTPNTWPSRSSYFGVADTCCFPKDGFYFYQSRWSDKPMIHLVTHWNWEGSEGKEIKMIAFSNCDYAEIFLNGEKIGSCQYREEYAEHLHFEVPYRPGELKAIGYKDGKPVAEDVIRTAGKKAGIKLTADRMKASAGGRDLIFVTADVVDENGNIDPFADDEIIFTGEEGLKILGVDNGDPEYVGSLKSDRIPALAGKCLAVVGSDFKGTYTFKAQSSKLIGAEISLSFE